MLHQEKDKATIHMKTGTHSPEPAPAKSFLSTMPADSSIILLLYRKLILTQHISGTSRQELSDASASLYRMCSHCFLKIFFIHTSVKYNSE